MHRRIDLIVTLLAGLVLLAFVAAPAFARTKDDAVSVTADPIVYLEYEHVGACSGFVANVFGKQMIVTAAHCFVEGKEAKVVTAKDSLGRVTPVDPVYVDTIHDVAVYEYTTLHYPAASATLGCDAKLAIGDDTYIDGYPWDFGHAVTYGKVASVHGQYHLEQWPDQLLLDVFTAPGSSGSAAFNASGQVIGILVGGDPKWQNISVVVPITELCRPEVM